MIKQLSAFVLLYFWLALFSVSSYAEVGLWQISKGDTTSYLFGTVHVGDKQMQGLPDKVKRAIEKSDKVMVEVNLESLSPLQIQQRSMPFMLLQGNETLQSTLSPAVYKKVVDYFAAKQIDVALFERYAPWAVMVTILQLEYQRLGFSEANGIDKQVVNYAQQHNIPIGEFESLEYQLKMFSQLGQYSDAMLQETFTQMADLDTYFLDMISAWRQGDLKQLEHYYNTSFAEGEYGALAERLMIKERNNNWLEALQQQLPHESLFVAVGALHLVERYGLITQLQQQGYTVSKI
ncbi:TraB/GumN family protein [Pseudoalteromonas 'SMAR']|uniref:TraB/GumN family protein n=1 Tax=Pseudoalteromonas 'SMAR' TaxID=3416908 RepID=UPI003AF1E592